MTKNLPTYLPDEVIEKLQAVERCKSKIENLKHDDQIYIAAMIDALYAKQQREEAGKIA